MLLAVGEVTAEDAGGAMRVLKRRSQILEGDTITVAQGGRAQIRFSDGSLLSLPESSQFRVDEYQLDANEPDRERAIYSLLKGGMRTLTGAIGKKNPENYRVNTPVATIGIRGTAYHAYLHRLPSGEVQLYGGVKHGSIVVENDGGASLFSTSQNFRVRNASEQAGALLRLPDFYPLQDEDGQAADGAGDEETGNGSTTDAADVSESQLSDETTVITIGTVEEDAVITPISDTVLEEPLPEEPLPTEPLPEEPLPEEPLPTEPLPEEPTTTTATLAPIGSMVGMGFVGTNVDGIAAEGGVIFNYSPNEVYLDTVGGAGNIPVSATVYDVECNPCTFDAGTASLVDLGGDATIGINWGRWEGDFVVLENGIAEQAVGSFHYIYTPNITPLSVVQARSGYVSYMLSGGTMPTDQAGNVGALQSFDMYVNFDAQSVDSVYLSGTVGTTSFNATSLGSVSITDALNTDLGIKIEDTSNALVGRVDMQFIGSNAEGIAATYGLQGNTPPSQTAITGTALLLESSQPAF
ncbi:MAG: FecR family protein [Gammaproteobacteria bacterium]|nr:FecR family protein [Gammaproteobacteria bacterium]